MRRAIEMASVLMLGLVGCDDATGTGDLDPGIVQDLIEEIVVRSMQSATYAAFNTERAGPNLAFGLQLPGVEHGSLGAGTSFPGAPPGTFEPFCQFRFNPPEHPFWEGRDICTRLTKISDTEYTVDVYFTVQPIESPDEAHDFSYTGAEPTGTFTFTPNPLLSYHHDFAAADSDLVTAQGEFGLTYRAAEGRSVDLSHRAFFSSESLHSGTVTVAIELEFAPGPLCAESAVVHVTDDGEEVVGEIACSGATLAVVGHGADSFTFDWN